MKLFANTLIVLVIATVGCEQSQSKSALSALEADNAKLTRQLEDANKKTAEMDQRIGAIESADANQVRQLKDAIFRVESTVNSLKTSIGPLTGLNINHRIQTLETDVRFMKMKVR